MKTIPKLSKFKKAQLRELLIQKFMVAFITNTEMPTTNAWAEAVKNADFFMANRGNGATEVESDCDCDKPVRSIVPRTEIKKNTGPNARRVTTARDTKKTIAPAKPSKIGILVLTVFMLIGVIVSLVKAWEWIKDVLN